MPQQETRESHEAFCRDYSSHLSVERGIFGAKMEVEILNDGPVALTMDNRNLQRDEFLQDLHKALSPLRVESKNRLFFGGKEER